MWFWLASRMRAYLWTRRSHHFAGLIPHFGTCHVGQARQLFALEYVPPKRDLWTPRNMALFFDGAYRVWEFRAIGVRRFKTARAASDWITKRGGQCSI